MSEPRGAYTPVHPRSRPALITDRHLTSGYQPWSKWKRRRVHTRWRIADLFHNIGYRIGGDA